MKNVFRTVSGGRFGGDQELGWDVEPRSWNRFCGKKGVLPASSVPW